jgi:short-subunit dehydrogenase
VEEDMSTVLVTGASRGIGRATALALTAAGHRVIATARDPHDLADVGAAVRLALDVTDPESVRAAIQEAGPIDVLVNNAGIAAFGPVQQTPASAATALFDVNVVGALRTTAAVLPAMRERGTGLIVNLSSAVAHVPLPMVGLYSASKAALEAMSQTLAMELRGTGVDVVVLQLGLVDSGAADRTPVYLDATDPHYAPLAGAAGDHGQTSSPELVAAAVVDVVERRTTSFRVQVGDDAADLLGARREKADDDYFAMIAQMVGLSVQG